ncbi:NUDIX hydrolase [Patescibacteria group bacterium]|nr:NUDIX hydrolase [Patescibacteria group bacterium]MBU1916021.1 NUDIX hydrolase [Patescibacteria group bacterium]
MESIPSTKLFASVVLQKNNRVLVLSEKDDEGEVKYNIPGGSIEMGESPNEAALRECVEETGLTARITDFIQVVCNTWLNKRSVLLYFSGCSDSESMKFEDGIEGAWMTLDEILAIPDISFVFGSKSAILNVLDSKQSTKIGLRLRKSGEEVDWQKSPR